MKTFDFLKKVHNVETALEWAVIEETINGTTTIKPAVMLKNSRLFISLLERRFYTESRLPEFSRRVYPAKRINHSQGLLRFEARKYPEKGVVVFKNFINDTYGVGWYSKDLEEQTLL